MPYKDIDKRRKTQALSRRKKNAERREKIIETLGAKCSRCGYDDKRALVIDHIEGGGTKERGEMGGGYYSKVLEKIKEGSKEYQILCCNCNHIKNVETEITRKY
jgi:hypothetical protein